MPSPPSFDEFLVAGRCVGFFTGVIFSCLMLAVLHRTGARQAGRRPSIAVALCILAYSASGFALAVLFLGEGSNADAATASLDLVMKIAAAIFPVFLLRLIGDVTVFSRVEHVKAERWLFGLSIGNAAFFVAGITLSAFDPGLHQRLETLLIVRILAANRLLLCALGAWIALRSAPDSSASRNFLVLTLAALTTSISAAIVPRLLHLPASATVLLGIVVGQAPLMIAPAGLLLFGRFRAADVFLKRSLQLSVVVVVSFCYWLAFRSRWPGIFRVESPYRDAITTIVFCLSAAAGWLLMSAASERINRAADRWLLGSFNYRHTARAISTGILALNEETAIFQYTRAELNRVLETQSVEILPRASFAEEAGAALDTGEPLDVLPDDPVRTMLAGVEVDLLVPVRVGANVQYVLAIVPGSRRRGLVAGEIAFIRSAATSLGTRLESLSAERERYDRDMRESRLAHLAVQAELKALQSQVNPHFLFNSLNTIAAMIPRAPARAEEMTVRLSLVFRHVLLNGDKQLSAVSEELDFLRTYLQIEEARFGDRLAVAIEMDPRVRADVIPTLILQPLVENAIKHGLAPKTGSGHLTISARPEDSFLRLSVEDDGMGYSRSLPLPGAAGVGLRNVEDRLKTFYKGLASLRMESRAGCGTSATILIPRRSV